MWAPQQPGERVVEGADANQPPEQQADEAGHEPLLVEIDAMHLSAGTDAVRHKPGADEIADHGEYRARKVARKELSHRSLTLRRPRMGAGRQCARAPRRARPCTADPPLAAAPASARS